MRRKIKNKKNVNSKKGSALAETVLLIAVSLVLIVVVFYPQISTAFTALTTALTGWFSNAIAMLGNPP